MPDFGSNSKPWQRTAAVLVGGGAALALLLATTPATTQVVRLHDSDTPLFNCVNLYRPPLSLAACAGMTLALVGGAGIVGWPQRRRRVVIVVLAVVCGLLLTHRYVLERAMASELDECIKARDRAEVEYSRRRQHERPPSIDPTRGSTKPCNCPPGDPLCSCL